MGAKQEAQDWAATVSRYGERNGLTYEEVGGINPKDGPVALCVGGVNRLTGQLAEGFWGSSCDADEKEVGSLFDKAVLPTAILAKAHMPDLAQVVPAFNVESIEGHEVVTQRFSRKVEFESIDFNKRFWATVPSESRPGGAAGAVRPRLPRLGDDDDRRDRLRRQRSPALVPLAPARAQRGGVENGAEERRRTVQTAAGRRWTRAASTSTRPGPGTRAWSRSPMHRGRWLVHRSNGDGSRGPLPMGTR